MKSRIPSISISQAMSWPSVIGVVYALLIPAHVLSDYPWIAAIVSLMEGLFPAIGNLARFSPMPEVVKVFYSTLWMIFPLMLAVVAFSVPIEPRTPPSYFPTRLKSLLAALVMTGIATMFICMLGFLVSATPDLKPLATGGRGNAAFIGLTSTRLGMGVLAPFMFVCMCVFIKVSCLFFADIFSQRKS